MNTVLLGEISSYKSIVIAKFLKKVYPQLKIIGYDYKKFTRSIRTKYCDKIILVENPKQNKQNHISSLTEIIKTFNIDLFLPVDSGMYGEYVKFNNLLGSAFSYIGDFKTYDLLHDKSKSQN